MTTIRKITDRPWPRILTSSWFAKLPTGHVRIGISRGGRRAHLIEQPKLHGNVHRGHGDISGPIMRASQIVRLLDVRALFRSMAGQNIDKISIGAAFILDEEKP